MRRSAAATTSKVIILDEPTATLGVREAVRVRKLIDNLRGRGLPVVLVSHDVAQVFEIADRIHVQHLGKRAAVVTPQRFGVADVVAIMSGATRVDVKRSPRRNASPTRGRHRAICRTRCAGRSVAGCELRRRCRRTTPRPGLGAPRSTALRSRAGSRSSTCWWPRRRSSMRPTRRA